MGERTALRLIAAERFGGMNRAAAAAGVHSNTLYRAEAGLGISAESRKKIEATFGYPLDELIQPAKVVPAL